MITMLRPLPGGMYDPDSVDGPIGPLFADLAYLIDADSHHHHAPCGIWCPRTDVLVRTITDDGGPMA